MKESDALTDQPQFIRQLKAMPAFKSFSEEILQELLKMIRIRQYEKGEVIIKEGQRDTRLFVLVKGGVKIFKGEQLIGQLQRSGDIFGEMGVIDGSPRSASVVSSSTSLCLALDAAAADEMEVTKRDIFYSILYRLCAELLASRLRLTNEQLYKARSELDLMGKKLKEFSEKETRIVTPFGVTHTTRG